MKTIQNMQFPSDPLAPVASRCQNEAISQAGGSQRRKNDNIYHTNIKITKFYIRSTNSLSLSCPSPSLSLHLCLSPFFSVPLRPSLSLSVPLDYPSVPLNASWSLSVPLGPCWTICVPQSQCSQNLRDQQKVP